MSEVEKREKWLNRETCIWAKISLFSALSFWIVVVLVIFIGAGFKVTSGEGYFDKILECILIFSPGLMIIAFVAAIVGSIRIIAKKGILQGWRYIIYGSVLIFLFIAMVSLPPYIGYRKSPPIHTASGNGNIMRVKELLAKKPQLANLKSLSDSTPLHLAAGSGHKDIVAVLIANGANVNAKNNYDETPLYSAMFGRCQKEVVELLIANGADVNAKNSYGTTPLMAGAGSSDCSTDVMELLISKGAEINAKNREGQTATDLATKEMNKEKIELLLKNGGVKAYY